MKPNYRVLLFLGLIGHLYGQTGTVSNVFKIEDITTQFPQQQSIVSVKSTEEQAVILTETALYYRTIGSFGSFGYSPLRQIISEKDLPPGQKLAAKTWTTTAPGEYEKTKLVIGQRSLYFSSLCPVSFGEGKVSYIPCIAWKFENYQTLKRVVAKGDAIKVRIPFYTGERPAAAQEVSPIWPSTDGTREFIFLNIKVIDPPVSGLSGLFEIVDGTFQLILQSSSLQKKLLESEGIWAEGKNLFFMEATATIPPEYTLFKFDEDSKQRQVVVSNGMGLFGEKVTFCCNLDQDFTGRKLYIRYNSRYPASPLMNRLAVLTEKGIEKVLGPDVQIPIWWLKNPSGNAYIQLLPIRRADSNDKPLHPFTDTLGFGFVSEPERGITTLIKAGDTINGIAVEQLTDLVAVHGCNAEFATQKADGSPDRWYRFSFVCAQQAPSPEILGIINGASFDLNQPLAPGTIFSLFGKNLGTAESARAWPLPRKLGGTKVTICGVDSPLFVNTGPMTRAEGGQLWQINGVVPYKVGDGWVVSGITCDVMVYMDQKPPLAALTARAGVKISGKPEETLALFTFAGFHPNGAQTQEPIITNQRGQLIATPGVSIPGADPAIFTQARACEVVTLWATGGGRTIPSVADGEPAPSEPLARMETTPAIQIFGVDAEVLFAGLAPGFAGLYQINVRVPCEATPGDQWLWFGRQPNPGKVYKIWVQ